jgi:actin-related protein
MNEDREVAPLVIDNGTGCVKAGFGGDDAPRGVIPNVLGKPKPSFSNLKAEYIGVEAQSMRDFLQLTYPMKSGQIIAWEAMERLWHHIFKEVLQISPDEHPILLTDAILSSQCDREIITCSMFETFNSPAVYLIAQPVLSFYSLGRTSGLVLEIGDGVTQAAPIWEGYTVRNANLRLNVGGRDCTEYLAKLLNLRGYSFYSSGELENVRLIKEKFGFAASDRFGVDCDPVKYELPDGQVITLDSERYKCAEPLFDTGLLGISEGSYPQGIHLLVEQSLNNCPIDFRRDLKANILLAGGGSMFDNLGIRVENELKSVGVPPRVRIVSPENRSTACWVGGSILSTLSTFQQMWITRLEYDEYGPAIVGQKCYKSTS